MLQRLHLHPIEPPRQRCMRSRRVKRGEVGSLELGLISREHHAPRSSAAPITDILLKISRIKLHITQLQPLEQIEPVAA